MSTPTHAPRVAFQGERGAFSEEAAVRLLGDRIELVSRPTFEALFASIDEGVADCALVPIENTLVGSVHRSYDLLLKYSLHITGEVVIPITHNVIGCSNASFAEITTVQSHPVALAQCERFFAAHPHIKAIAADDTAGSVAEVIERGNPTWAAIAGRRAAEVYGGSILREGVEDHPENYTRFVLLRRHPHWHEEADKLSLVLKLHHRPGALHHALAPFARRDINLLKIESRPVKGQPWQHHFYLDLKASVSDSNVATALAELNEYAMEVRLLGCYRAAREEGSQLSPSTYERPEGYTQ